MQKLGREITPQILMIGLWFLHSALFVIAFYHCINFHFIIFNTFRDMLRTNLQLQTNRKGNNSLITCNRVMALALCTFSDGRLSIYQVSFNSLPYFQRYAPDKLFITIIK